MIKQVRFAQSVKFFEPKFIERWKVDSYHDINAPALFVGVYNEDDLKAINNHRGFKLTYNTGKMRAYWNDINPENLVMVNKPYMDYAAYSSLKQFKQRTAYIEMKDFSEFTPTTLGNKIYCYLGNERLSKEMGLELANFVKRNSEFEVMMGLQGNSIEWVKCHFYNNCFVNLKPNLTGGYSTAIELAHMGRMTISNGKGPFCIPFNNPEEVLQIINQESKKIGTIQSSVMGELVSLGDEWKDEKYWI